MNNLENDSSVTVLCTFLKNVVELEKARDRLYFKV